MTGILRIQKHLYINVLIYLRIIKQVAGYNLLVDIQNSMRLFSTYIDERNIFYKSMAYISLD